MDFDKFTSNFLLMRCHEITTNEFQLDSRMFSQSLDDRTDAPWLTDIDEIKYSSIISEPLRERVTNISVLQKDDATIKQDDFVNSLKNDTFNIENQPIVDESITKNQNQLVRPIVTPNPIIKYMKLTAVDFDYKASGLPNKVQACFFTWNDVPLTEIAQINFDDDRKLFQLFNRKLESVVMPYTDDDKNTFLICVLKMVKDQNSVAPFAFGSTKCNQDGLVTFNWTAFSNTLSLADHLKKDPLLKIKFSIKITNNVHPEDKITARITPYNPMMPSPFLVIYDFHILAKPTIDNYKVKIFIKDDDENKENLYASPTDNALRERFKSHVAFSDTMLFLPEHVLFLLNPGYDKVLTMVVNVCQEGVLMSTIKQTFTFRLDLGRQQITKVIDGTTISFGYLYPSLIAPNAALRLPMQMPNVPPQFDSTVFDDLWPYILLRNLNSSKISLNFLSALFAHIPQDKISNFADKYFYCSEEFFAGFLDQMTADPAVVERIPYHLFPLLFKGLCLHQELIEVMINYICGILASEKRVQTKFAAIEMLLRMRLIFDPEEIELKLVGIITKLTDIEKVEIFCIIFSDGNYMTDACATEPTYNKSSNYNMLLSLFFSTATAMLPVKGNAKLVLKALQYLVNTLQRYGLDGGSVISPLFGIVFAYHKLLKADPSFPSIILSLLDTKYSKCSQEIFDNLTHAMQKELITLLQEISTTRHYVIHAYNFILRLQKVHSTVMPSIVEFFLEAIKIPKCEIISFQALSVFINKGLQNFFMNKESVFIVITKLISKLNKTRFFTQYIQWFIDLDTVGHTNAALALACLQNFDTLYNISDFYDNYKLPNKPFSKPPSTAFYLEECLILNKIIEQYPDIPEIKENCLKRLTKLNTDNDDLICAAIADGNFETLHKAGLDQYIVESDKITDNKCKEVIAQSCMSLDQQVQPPQNYYRVFVSGPLATGLEGSDFIYMGDTKKFMETVHKHYKDVKINAKLIPMFGQFQTITVQVLPVRQASPTTYEYDFMMPDEGWSEVYSIRYLFVTNKEMPTTSVMVPATHTGKKQITKEEYFIEKFDAFITNLERLTQLTTNFLPQNKFVKEWLEGPIVPCANELIYTMSRIEYDLTPSVNQLIHSSQGNEGADIPQTIRDRIEKFKKAIVEAHKSMSQIDGLEKKQRFIQAIENCKFCL